MANVTASVSQVNVNVIATPSVISVTDVDTNVTLSNITESITNVTVSSSTVLVDVAQLGDISAFDVRSKLSVDDTGGDGSLTYSNITGIFTYTGPNQDEANARIDAAPANVRAHISATDPVLYNSSTGVISLNNTTLLSGVTTDDLAEGSANLYYTNQRVIDEVFKASSGSTPYYFSHGPGLDITTSGSGAAWFLTANTSLIPEGANLYYTTDRANAAMDDYLVSITANVDSVNGYTGTVILDTSDLQENGNLFYTTDRANTAIQTKLTDGTFVGNLAITGDPTFTGEASVTGNLSVGGNLDITGNINYNEVTDLLVQDQTITLNYGNLSVFSESGIIVDRSPLGRTNVELMWDQVAGRWEFSKQDGFTITRLPIARDTDDLAEGTTNLYYSNTLVQDYISDSTTLDPDVFYANTIYMPRSVKSDYPHIYGNANVWIGSTGSSPFARFFRDNYFGVETYVNHLSTGGVNTYQTFTKTVNAEEQYGSGDDAEILKVNSYQGNFVLKYNPSSTHTLTMNTQSGHTAWYKDGSAGQGHLVVDGNVRTNQSMYVKDTLFVNNGIQFDVDGGGADINGLEIGFDSNVLFLNNNVTDQANAMVILSPTTVAAGPDSLAYLLANSVYAVPEDGWYIGSVTANVWNRLTDTSTANVISVNGYTGVVSLDADDIAETATRQYFSNAKVDAHLASGTGPLVVNGDTSLTGNVDIYGTGTDRLTLISADMYTNGSINMSSSGSDINMSFGVINMTNVASTANAISTTGIIATSSNVEASYFIGDGSQLQNLPVAPVDSVNGQTGVVVLDTGDLQESGNLFFTTARANSAMDAYLTSITANVDSVNGATGVVVLDTDDISEGTTNKYYSSTLFNADFATKTTTDLTEGANLYFTTGRANSAIDAYVTGGNAITVASGVVSLDNTAVTPGTYGNATHVAQFTVDQQGRLTAVTDVTISGAGAAANSFGIISVAGQSNVEADVSTDQVTFVAGSGVTITTDAATDSITFNSTGGYGNVDVQNFLENGYGSGNILTAGNITGGYIIAGNDAGGDGYFIGDINGAIQNEVYNASGSTLNKGDIVALNGAAHGDVPDVVLADAGNASLMPGFGVVKNSISPGVTGEVVISGKMNFPNSFTVGAQLYVNGAGQFTETQPLGEANLVQKIAKVVSSTSINVAGAGRTNATPNLDNGNIFIGDATNRAVSIDLDNFTYAISSSADISTTANVDAEVVNTRRQVYTFPSSTDKNFVDLDNYDTPGAANIILISGKFSVNHLFDTQGLGADTWSVKSGNANVAVANTWIKVSGNGVTELYGGTTRTEGTFVANGAGTGLQVTNSSQFDGSITAVDATFNGDVVVNEFDLDVRSESNANYIHSSVTKYANPEADITYVTPFVEVNHYGGNISAPATLGTGNIAGSYTGSVYTPRTFDLHHPTFGNLLYANPNQSYVSSIIMDNTSPTVTYKGPTFTSSFGGLPANYEVNVPQGRILFKTMNSDVANATIADGFRDGTSFQNGLQKANATVAYIDNQFNIGREDDGTSFSFPKTAGSTDQFLALDANSDLQWTSTLNNVTLGQFQETKVDLGSVSGDQSSALDAASGSIYTLTATGGITINSLANAVAGTSMTIIITQDGVGSHALTSSMKFAGADKTLSTAPGSIDIISVFYDGTNYYASLTKGYA